MANPINTWHVDRLRLTAKQPAKSPVLMALGKTFYRFLVETDATAVTDSPADVAMGDLQRSCSLCDCAGGERGGVDIQHLRACGAGLKHGVIFRQQIRSALLFRKQQRITPPLQHLGKDIETVFPEHQVAISEPDPVGFCGQRGTVATDTAAEQLLFGNRLPVPGDTWHLLLPEERQ